MRLQLFHEELNLKDLVLHGLVKVINRTIILKTILKVQIFFKYAFKKFISGKNGSTWKRVYKKFWEYNEKQNFNAEKILES